MRRQNVQVLGITRWSYPGLGGGFRNNADDLSVQRARLYDPARLDHRLFLLEHVLLPCLRGQADQDFQHIFLMGDQLPEPWRSRVSELFSTVPQIIPVFHPEGEGIKDVCRKLMLDNVDPACEATAQYRLDDDDAIGLTFSAQARGLFPDLRPHLSSDGKLALDFCRGFLLGTSQGGIEMEPVSMRFWAPGLVIYQRPDSARAVLDYHHLKVWHSMPTLIRQDRPMFIRGAHHDNDSQLATFRRKTRGYPFNVPNINRYTRRQFGIDLREISRLWDDRKDRFLGLAKRCEETNPACRSADAA